MRSTLCWEQARRVGATIVKEAADAFYGGYAGYFQDPDQYLRGKPGVPPTDMEGES
jgi:hypothetical protein